MKIVREDQQDKIDAIEAQLRDLDDQLAAARDMNDPDKERSIQDHIDSLNDQLDKLENPEKKEQRMRIVKEATIDSLMKSAVDSLSRFLNPIYAGQAGAAIGKAIVSNLDYKLKSMYEPGQRDGEMIRRSFLQSLGRVADDAAN